jgi:hypothetical protein
VPQTILIPTRQSHGNALRRSTTCSTADVMTAFKFVLVRVRLPSGAEGRRSLSPLVTPGSKQPRNGRGQYRSGGNGQ